VRSRDSFVVLIDKAGGIRVRPLAAYQKFITNTDGERSAFRSDAERDHDTVTCRSFQWANA
jgi:hypothetical protein